MPFDRTPFISLFFGLLPFGCTASEQAPSKAAQDMGYRAPNLIFILADDLGYGDLGCYGQKLTRTPNIDKLAADGLRFTDFYNTGRCSPTRAALLTGLYSHQAGVGDMAQDRGSKAYRGVLNDQCVTIAEMLRSAGYRTAMTGKWHVGHERPHWPTDRGFDHFYGSPRGGDGSTCPR